MEVGNEDYFDQEGDQQDDDDSRDDSREDGEVEGEEYEEFIGQEFSLGRDGRTKWYTNKPKDCKPRLKTAPYPGVEPEALHVSTPDECWSLFFTESMLTNIVNYTNSFLDEQSKLEQDGHSGNKHTTISEMKAFISLLYLCGIYKSDNMSVAELWKKDGTGLEVCSLMMTLSRFTHLLHSVQFDDVHTRAKRKKVDKLAPVRDLIVEFASNCQKVYHVADLVYIREKYEPFRGKCSFKQYLPGSRSHYGLRIFTAVDAVMFYTFNLEVDVPNQVDGEFYVDRAPERTVLRLSQPALNKGRCVVVDQPASFKLAKKLMAKKTYFVGELIHDEPEIPEHFLNVQTNKTQIGYTDESVLVSSCKKNKCSVVLSTRPEEVAEDLPQFLSVMHNMFRSVDGTEANIRNIERTDSRWPVVVFCSLLNIAAKNALIIRRCNGKEVDSTKDYIRKLAMSLCHDHLVGTMKMRGVPFTMKTRIAKITKCELPEQCLSVATDHGGRNAFRCQECPSRKRKKTKTVCKDCKKYLCLDHLVKICSTCYEQQSGIR